MVSMVWSVVVVFESKFARFRVFLGTNQQIQVRFSSSRIFFKDSNFWCVSKFNHMQRDCTCACVLACLCPENSISNVVVSLTIHLDI